jgi:hypothetical protein
MVRTAVNTPNISFYEYDKGMAIYQNSFGLRAY